MANEGQAGSCRRRFLRAGVALAGAAVGGCLGDDERAAGTAGARGATVAVDPGAPASDWTVDARILGTFLEHNGRDVYPGVYSDHVANGSFEVWNRTGPRTALLFDVETSPGVAYGWEPVAADGRVGFEHVEGGVHGRAAEPDLASGDEIAPWNWPWPREVDGPRFQRVNLDGRGGVRQRTALPDGRTRTYEAEFSVRGDGVSTCAVALTAPDGTVLARATVPVGSEWQRHAVTLDLDARSERRYHGTPFGTYALSLVGEGAGNVDLDWVLLRAGDAVEGTFNPTTLELLREFGVTSIRWPGGNFASQYRWRDGVGPPADRPVVPNCNWGGLERNYLGTNEFLRFCELADVDPLVTVGAWTHVPPEEAGAWVEYVNGSTDTEMGALRAAHGYPEPWGVTAWQVGNEVWGSYQVGHTDAAGYADRYEAYHEAMTAADPSIEIDAVGIDPGYTEFSDGSAFGRGLGRRPTWNEVVFERAGARIEGLDVHQYTRGVKLDAARRLWLARNGADPVTYNEVLVNFPTQFGRLLDEVRERAAARGVDDLRLNVGEWNLQPAVGEGWPRAGYPTMAHAAYVASTFNTFVRRGEAVRLAYQRDNTLYFRPYPRDTRPVNPGNYVRRLYGEHLADGDWHHLPVDVDCATFTVPKTGIRIRRSEAVPYLDVAAVRSAGGRVVVFAVNRNLRTSCEMRLDVAGADDGDAVPVTLVAGEDGDPFARRTRWDAVDGFAVTEREVPVEEGVAAVTMPPASVARLWLSGRPD